MDDRELLELAAKAAGEDVEWLPDQKVFYRKSCNWPQEKGFFLPLHNDGEALRLAVTLFLDTCFYRGFEEVIVQGEGTQDTPTTLGEILEVREPFGSDIQAATRRAIVRAAAEIGKSM
jgi:hypothetical protein